MAEESKTHWDELARQLGLEPKGPPEAAAAPHDKVDTLPSEPEAREPEPIAEAERLTPEFEDDTKLEGHERFESLDEPPDDAIAEDLEITDFTMEETEPESEEAVPEPKRRRGRRSRSGRDRETDASANAEGETALPPDTEAAEDSSGPKRGRRGRGRGRSKKARSEEFAAAPSDEAVNSEIEPASNAAGDEDDTEEIDTLSDWSVPSWQELIASLYRPDR